MKKKILFVLNNFQYSDGVATSLKNLIININKDLYDIHILPLYKCDEDFCQAIKGMAKIHKGLGFYHRGMSHIMNRIPLKWLYQIFIKEQFDLEIAYQFGLSTKILSISLNPHKICWMHGYDTKMELRKYYKSFYKIISVAKEGSQKLKEEGFKNTDYCYNIIDESDIYIKSTESVEIEKTRKYVIATVCRIAPDKAIMRQIRCIQHINQFNKNAEFWIIGGGPDFEKVKSYVEENKMQEYVKLIGSQTNPFKYLKKADLFLLASTTEGFNIACQEAAILGIPVITTEVGGAHELIDLAGCGEVIPNNEESIKKRLLAIISDNNLINSWKGIAKKNKYHFFKQPRIEKIEEIIDDAISFQS